MRIVKIIQISIEMYLSSEEDVDIVELRINNKNQPWFACKFHVSYVISSTNIEEMRKELIRSNIP